MESLNLYGPLHILPCEPQKDCDADARDDPESWSRVRMFERLVAFGRIRGCTSVRSIGDVPGAVVWMCQVAPHAIRVIVDRCVLIGDIRRLTWDTEDALGTQWVRAVDRFLASVFHLYPR